MQLSKQLCVKIARVGLGVVGGMVVMTAIGGIAMATPVATPEIDPTSITSAVTLFFGSVMLLTGRRKLK